MSNYKTINNINLYILNPVIYSGSFFNIAATIYSGSFDIATTTLLL